MFWGIVVLALVFLISAGIFIALGRWLIVEDPLVRAEVAVVPTGELLERIETAVKLYQTGYVKNIIVTGYFPAFSVFKLKEFAVQQGVPAERIITENVSQGTYEHTWAVSAIMKQRDWQTMILVTSPYHSRRAAWIFKKAAAGAKIKVISYPARPAWFKADSWWRHPNSALQVRWEYKKLAYYYWHYGLLGWLRTKK